MSLSHFESLGLSSEPIRWSWPIAAEAALALGDHTEVSRLLGWFDDYPMGHIPPVLNAERLRLRARLLAAQREPLAGAAFDIATQAFRDVGSPYHLAVELLDHADHLAAVGDVAVAQRLAAEAATIADRLGARPLMGRAHRFTEWTSQPDHVTGASRRSAV